MIGYASNTGTRRNLKALREAGWRLLLTPSNQTIRDGFRYGIDNDAWRCYQQGIQFDGDAFDGQVTTEIPLALQIAAATPEPGGGR